MRRRTTANIVSSIPSEFIIIVKTDNAGTSNSDQFTIPTTGTGYNYNVSTDDGYSATGLTGDHTITFPTGAGTHEVYISGDFPRIYFNDGGDRLKLLDITNWGIYGIGSTSQASAFYGCSNLVINATDVGYFENVTDFSRSWRNCSSLTSFPLIDTSSGTSFSYAWFNCSSLTSFPLIDTSSGTSFGYAWYGCSSLTSFPLIDTSSGTSFSYAWFNCSSLTSFPLIDTSSGINFQGAWRNCSSLTSFPLIDTSSCTNFTIAWYGCSSLTSFPLIDTSSGTSFGYAWYGCSSLTSFPLIDTSSGTSFGYAWFGCSSLTSFPLIDTSSGTSFFRTWRNCSSLTSFPANAFDTNIATDYTDAFSITNLSTQSIDDILVSLDTSGVSNGTFTQSGGNAPSATGQAAIVSLVAKGWTIIVIGGYTP